MNEFPTTIEDLQAELDKHAKDGRTDSAFRFAIAVDQLGTLVRHLTHDQKENPISRPHGNRRSEIDAAGHALIQVATYIRSRGIPLQEAIDAGLANCRDKDFIKRNGAPDIEPGVMQVRGVVASSIQVYNQSSNILCGKAFVDENCTNLKEMPEDSILVSSHPTEEITPYLHLIYAVVTDHGGMSCHAAILCRERGIPCVVGTGNATKVFNTGELITINTEGSVVNFVPRERTCPR